MTELKIDMTGTPPTLGQIEAWRERAQRDAANADAAERNIVRWSWVIACVAGVMLAGLDARRPLVRGLGR